MQGSFAALMRGAVAELRKPPGQIAQPPTQQQQQAASADAGLAPPVSVIPDFNVAPGSDNNDDDSVPGYDDLPDYAEQLRDTTNNQILMTLDRDYTALVHACVPMKDFFKLWAPAANHMVCPSQDTFYRVVTEVLYRLAQNHSFRVSSGDVSHDGPEIVRMVSATTMISRILNEQWEYMNYYAVSALVRQAENRVFERLLTCDVFKVLNKMEDGDRFFYEYRLKLFLRRDRAWQPQFASAVGTFLCWDTLKTAGRSSIKEHNRAEYDFNSAFMRLLDMLLQPKKQKELLDVVDRQHDHLIFSDYTGRGYNRRDPNYFLPLLAPPYGGVV